jgi:hypothetical protein
MSNQPPPPKPTTAGKTLWKRLREQIDEAVRALAPPPEPELIPIPVRRR